MVGNEQFDPFHIFADDFLQIARGAFGEKPNGSFAILRVIATRSSYRMLKAAICEHINDTKSSTP